MSWSVSATGKGEALSNELSTQFDQAESNTASIPEEQATVIAAREMVKAAVATMPSGCDVSASGYVSGYVEVDDGKGGKKHDFSNASGSVVISILSKKVVA